jgi:tetratricopeptide (TPR) repeat protein
MTAVQLETKTFGLMREAPDVVLKELPQAIRDIDWEKKVPEYDIRKEIEKAKGTAQKPTLAFEPILPPAALSTRDMIDSDMLLLQQAQVHVQKKEYSQALEKLKELLGRKPEHPEGLYLNSYCVLALDNRLETFHAEIAAAENLELIHRSSISRDLRERVENLRSTIREKSFIKFTFLFLLGIRDGVAEQVARLITLDPSGTKYYIIQGILFLEDNRLIEAYASADQGARISAPHVPEMLVGLKKVIEHQLIPQALSGAIACLKKGRYAKARKKIKQLDQRIRQVDICRRFEEYLNALGGSSFLGITFGNRSQVGVMIPGAAAEREELERIIVNDEVGQALSLIARGDFVRAETVLVGASRHVSQYLYLKFLIAGCRFRKVGDALVAGRPPGIDTAISDLQSARELAREAASDKSIKGASVLIKHIDELLNLFQEISGEIKKRQEDARIMNPLVEEFTAIMKLAEGGIDSVEKFEEIDRRMKKLKTQIDHANKNVSSAGGLQNLRDLGGIVDRNQETLNKMRKDLKQQQQDMATVSEQGKSFQKIAGILSSGRQFQNRGEVSSFLDMVKSSRNEAQKAKSRVGSGEAQKALDQMISQYDLLLQNIERAL